MGEKNKKHNKIIGRKPGVKLGIIRRKITEYKSSLYTELLTVPYLLRAKITQVEESVYKSLEDGNFMQVDMTVQIEDVIKGQRYFTINGTITVSYLKLWFHSKTNDNKFEVDSSYFMPTGIFRLENKNTYQYAIRMLSDYNYAIFPIEAEQILIPGDIFNIGEIVGWKEFKDILVNHYVLK